MHLLTSIVDIFIVILLLRLVIRSNEVYTNPIHRLIYRITDPMISVSATIIRGHLAQTASCILAVVVLRGLIYAATGSVSIVSGVGLSLMNLLQLLFQAYAVICIVTILSNRSYGGLFLVAFERALHPLHRLSRQWRIRTKYHPLFLWVFLFVSYALSSGIVRSAFFGAAFSSILSPYGLLEAGILILGLFPFPGFFSLVIVVAALMSWVSPDPSNPIVQTIYGISEPLLQPFRRLIPNLGGLDISPILALICFHLIGSLGQQLASDLMRG